MSISFSLVAPMGPIPPPGGKSTKGVAGGGRRRLVARGNDDDHDGGGDDEKGGEGRGSGLRKYLSRHPLPLTPLNAHQLMPLQGPKTRRVAVFP